VIVHAIIISSGWGLVKIREGYEIIAAEILERYVVDDVIMNE
jgi:hypothetical protein